MKPSRHDQPSTAEDSQGQQVVVVARNEVAVADQPIEGKPTGGPADLVEHPGKVIRIASMVKQLLEEVRAAPLDDAGRTRLAEIHRRSISELEQGLAPELIEELGRITLPFGDEVPSDAELRVAQAQLVGWLEGLFHGIQATLFAQQMAAEQQIQTMRRGLAPGQMTQDGSHGPSITGHTNPREGGSTGQYL